MTRHDRLRIEEAIENDNFDKLIRLQFELDLKYIEFQRYIVGRPLNEQEL